MTSLHTTLSLAQMMVRAQHRHESRLAPHGEPMAGGSLAPAASPPPAAPASGEPQGRLTAWLPRALGRVATRR